MSKITVVIEYADGAQEPSFHAHMQCLGGEVVAVRFGDALDELEKILSATSAISHQTGISFTRDA